MGGLGQELLLLEACEVTQESLEISIHVPPTRRIHLCREPLVLQGPWALSLETQGNLTLVIPPFLTDSRGGLPCSKVTPAATSRVCLRI